MNAQKYEPEDQELKGWVDSIEQLSSGAVNFTVGLINGSREGSDRKSIDRLARCALAAASGPSLLVRLNLELDATPRRSLRSARSSETGPALVNSSLGPWKEAVVAMHLGLTAPANLERLPRWLSKWKREFTRIVIDLGPIHQPVCRTVGRYCDTSFLMLGPNSCASPLWIRQQLDILTSCHVAIAGSLLVTTQYAEADVA